MNTIDIARSPTTRSYFPPPRFDAAEVGRRTPVADGPAKLPLDIPGNFIAEILKPYRREATYLRSARLESVRDKRDLAPGSKETGLITASGRFSIPNSCYIDSTGHFNAVEFNICFNQLAYVVFGKCIDLDVLKNLRLDDSNMSFGEFRRNQLSSMLIVKIESRYYKMLKPANFKATLSIDRVAATGGAFFCFTSIDFSDDEGVKAKGTVLLAYNPKMVV